jgi:hypothetical protein
MKAVNGDCLCWATSRPHLHEPIAHPLPSLLVVGRFLGFRLRPDLLVQGPSSSGRSPRVPLLVGTLLGVKPSSQGHASVVPPWQEVTQTNLLCALILDDFFKEEAGEK